MDWFSLGISKFVGTISKFGYWNSLRATKNLSKFTTGFSKFSFKSSFFKYLIKIKGAKSKKEVTALIDEIVSNLEKNKLLNDEMYSDSKARMFLRRGYSLNKINQSLRNKGIEDKYVKQSIEKIKEDQIEPDFVSALKLCKRRRIGPLRPESNRELFYKKDMGILARNGFSFELSKRVLNLEADEFSKLIKLI